MTISYESSGVKYSSIDPLKIMAQRAAAKTGGSAAFRGESAFVWEEKDCYRALVIEGLGTKNLVADAMRAITGKTYYDAIAKDCVAMIVNDLITVGAAPQVVNAYFAVGDTRWFTDNKRARDLVRGWANACVEADAVWGGGETPVLKGVIIPDTIDLAGSAAGIVTPKKRLLSGDRLTPGDAIILIESSGIHANGLTLARAIAEKLPQGYATKLSDGSMYGESLLRPTHIYTRLIEALFQGGIAIHYGVNITGHGWRKLMRANRTLTYTLHTLAQPSPLFSFLQHHGKLGDRDMYETFNMGAGFAVFVSPSDAARTVAIAKRSGLHAWNAGTVSRGVRQVIIKSKGIVFSSKTLTIRH